MAHDDVMETLDRLVQTCRDAEHGFLAAADALTDAAIKRLFTAYAEQRAKFADELESEMRRLGGLPRARGSASGALHRAWMNLKAALSTRDEDVIIAEAERGEESARTTYEDALKVASLPADLRSVITRQFNRVSQTWDCLRELKHAA